MDLEEKPLILLVDDNPKNLQLLGSMLRVQGYKTTVTRSGAEALDFVRQRRPACILLDIMMPGMDGFETCRRLKAREASRDIPVIFITSLTDAQDKVRAFEAGGVDYITKPFQAEEVLARVGLQVRLYRLQQELQQRNAALRREADAHKRTAQKLQEANDSKDTFFSIIAHDLRSPFAALLGLSEFTTMHFDEYCRKDPAEMREMLEDIHSSAENLYALLENLLTWSRIQRGVMEFAPQPLELSSILDTVTTLFTSMADQKQITLRPQAAGGIWVYADLNMLTTVLRNLVSNALKFTPDGGQVDISAAPRDGKRVIVSVADSGVGIPAERLEQLFHLGSSFKTAGTDGEQGSGLGLLLCRDLLERQGGRLDVRSEPGRGSTFTCWLPADERASPNVSASPGEDAFEQQRAVVAQFLAQLPDDARQEVRQAIDEVNTQRLQALMAQHAYQHAEAAEAVAHLMNGHRFDVLQDMIAAF